jgi:hypothetical protein
MALDVARIVLWHSRGLLSSRCLKAPVPGGL